LQYEYVDSILEPNDHASKLGLKDRRASDWPDQFWSQLLEIGTQCAAEKKKDRLELRKVEL
jgi:hypothetical protein